jgi:hypothetical protein
MRAPDCFGVVAKTKTVCPHVIRTVACRPWVGVGSVSAFIGNDGPEKRPQLRICHGGPSFACSRRVALLLVPCHHREAARRRGRGWQSEDGQKFGATSLRMNSAIARDASRPASSSPAAASSKILIARRSFNRSRLLVSLSVVQASTKARRMIFMVSGLKNVDARKGTGRHKISVPGFGIIRSLSKAVRPHQY